MLRYIFVYAAFLLSLSSYVRGDRCTAISIGRSATVEGATMTTHANDCFDCDFRIVRVPRRTHAVNSTRDIPPVRFAYPRLVSNRSPHYSKENTPPTRFLNFSDTEMVGSIPQVSETYAVTEGSYAIINEFGVSLGESTCGAKLVSAPIYAGGRALLEITELGRIALERARTAREAIRIMGTLAQKYGYYSAEWEGDGAEGEAGEAYVIGDSFEHWVFHMSPDDTGASAVWVAKRVPDDHITVLANTFTIRQVPYPSHADPEVWMISDNLHAVASKLGFWRPDDGPLDFKAAFGLALPVWKEPYVARRMWRVYSLAAPSLHLASNLTSFELPFSVQPDSLLDLAFLKMAHRDHYENTKYDTTRGIAAGPYGNPNRYDAYEGGGASSPFVDKLMEYIQNKAKSNNARDIYNNSYNANLPLGSGIIPANVFQAAGQDYQIQCQFDYFSHIASSMRSEQECLRDAISHQTAILDEFTKDDTSIRSALSSILGSKGDTSVFDRSEGEPLTDMDILQGHHERTISLFRTSYTAISVSYTAVDSIREGPAYVSKDTRLAKTPKRKPVVYPRQVSSVTYIGLHQAKTSAFTPVFPALPYTLPVSFHTGSLYEAEPTSAWWVFTLVSNYCEKAWKYIYRDIAHVQSLWEQKLDALVTSIQQDFLSVYNTIAQDDVQDSVKDTVFNWNRVFDELLSLYDVHSPKELEKLNQGLFINDKLYTSELRVLRKEIDMKKLKDTSIHIKTRNDKVIPVTGKHAHALVLYMDSLDSLYTSADTLVSDWWSLFWRVLTRYHDGYRFDDPKVTTYTATPLFYPTWWLRAVRFWRQFGDDPAVTGNDYSHKPSTQEVPGIIAGAKAEYEVTATAKAAADLPLLPSREYDSKYYPGDQCLPPRSYVGQGPYAYVEDEYTDVAYRNGDKSIQQGCRITNDQAKNTSIHSVLWCVVVGLCTFVLGYILGHTKGRHTESGRYDDIPEYVDEEML